MKNKSLFIFCLMIALVFCGCAQASAVQAPTETANAVLPEDWEPALDVEQASPVGATVIFRQEKNPEGYVVLCGNDYTLERYSEQGWVTMPMAQQDVNWVKDAFVVTAIPRDEIDWQWLYGSLPNGHYRIGKTVTLHQNGENLRTSTVYGEFVLKLTEEKEESIYDASVIKPAAPVYTYAPLEELPASYSMEQAAADHVVTMRDGHALDNQHVWQSFVANAAAGQSVSVRCMRVDSGSGQLQFYDVSFDGFQYTVRWMENGHAQTLSFKHLLRFQGDFYSDPKAIDRYVLTMDDDVTWEDIQWGMVSRNELDKVPHMVVYQELAYHPAYPPIPDSSRVELSLRGKALITATEPAAAKLVSLFREAAVMAQQPDMYYMGLNLIFYGQDGSQVTLWLDIYGDHFMYDGTFYHYSTDTLFDILDIETWPEDVLFAFPEDIHG